MVTPRLTTLLYIVNAGMPTVNFRARYLKSGILVSVGLHGNLTLLTNQLLGGPLDTVIYYLNMKPKSYEFILIFIQSLTVFRTGHF